MKRIRWYDYITVNIYWLGLTTVSQSFALIIPLMVQRFVGASEQGTAFGTIRLYTLMVALLAQALFGMLSDHSTSRWGRRRPFILLGTLGNIVAIIAVGASPSYWFLFGVLVISQVASNAAHGAEQGLIPDLVPEDRRGRFSGVKAMMDLLPVIIVALTVGPMIAAGKMWMGIWVAVAILFAAMALTMLVREEPLREPPGRLNWEPFGRLAAMTLVFLVIILGLGAAVRGISALLVGVESVALLLVAIGIIGSLAIAIAVIVGVWASVRISIGGEDARRYPSFTWWVVNRLAFLVGTTNLAGFAVYFLQSRLGFEGEAAAGPASRLMMVVGVLILLCALPSGYLADGRVPQPRRPNYAGGFLGALVWVYRTLSYYELRLIAWIITTLRLNRLGRKGFVRLAGFTAALGALVLILAPNMTVVYVGGCIIGAATGMFFTTNWALGTDIVPKEQAGKYLGISNLAGAGAGAVGAYIGGPIADYFTRNVPQSPGLGYVLIFAIYGVMFLVSAIVLVRVREEWTAEPEVPASV